MEMLQRVNNNQCNALYKSCIILPTKCLTVTTAFKYMPSNNFHIPLYTPVPFP